MLRRLLALLFLAFPAVAHAEWREASSRHFVIYSEQSEADLRKMAEQLERFDALLRLQLRRPDPDRSPSTRLTIYVLRHQDRLESFLGFRGAAGVYMGRHTGSIAVTHEGRRYSGDGGMRGLDPQTTMLHEYTHHFMYSNFSFGAPLWFSEGYPEFWSTTRFGEDGSVSFGMPGGHRAVELTRLANVPAPRLVNMRLPITDEETYAAIYGRGWVLCHYLMFEPTRAGQLNAYLLALAQGKSSEEASAAFGDLNRLERELQDYVGRRNHSYVTLSARQLPIGPVTIRVLRPGEQAIQSIRMQSKRGVSDSQARDLVEPARRVAAQHPADALVQVTLAEVEHDAGNHAQAEAAANRAIALDPRIVEAHLFKARAIQARLVAPDVTATPEQWRDVRRVIAAANRLDPDDPEPLVAFYATFVAAKTQPTANAIEGLIEAQSYAKEDRELRVMVGRQMLLSGNLPAARNLLAPVASDSHSGRFGTRVGEILAIIEQGDRTAALARFDAALAERERRSR